MRILFGGRPDDELLEQVRSLVPGLQVVTTAELEADPGLVEQVEIAYGGFPRQHWPAAKRLRWLQTTGAGVNGLMTPAVLASEAVITNASGIHAEPITEHMFGLLLMHTRRLAGAWDQQREKEWNPRPLSQSVTMLAGRTLGVLGVGAIGAHSARVGAAFGMSVLGLRRTGEPCPHVETMFTPDARLDFFAACDVVMNSLPLTPRTRGFMGREEFAAIKPGAIVLNTGRGPTIDTDAMVEALRDGRLGGALLDVTDPEPLPVEHPLWSMENVIITPHYSGSHPGYNRRAAAIFLENLRRYVAGEPLVNVVDKDEGY
jgi:D-2-hydroxyacid dehydrogenase (NADP+)